MTNVEKLRRLGYLSDIRARLGAKDGDDTSFDKEINKMSARETAQAYMAWHTGDGGWASIVIDIYELVKKK